MADDDDTIELPEPAAGGQLPRAWAEAKGLVVGHPDYWRYAAASAAWPDGQTVTEAEFDEALGLQGKDLIR